MKDILIDFDGVLHSYTSGWHGKPNIPDEPNPGAIQCLREYLEHPEINPVIWTSRVHCAENEDPADSENARQAIREWLMLHGMTSIEVDAIKITNDKPPAVMLIDDRAFKFEGYFPTINFIMEFKPWNIKDEA